MAGFGATALPQKEASVLDSPSIVAAVETVEEIVESLASHVAPPGAAEVGVGDIDRNSPPTLLFLGESRYAMGLLERSLAPTPVEAVTGAFAMVVL